VLLVLGGATLTAVFMGGLLLLAAGRTDLPVYWAYVAVNALLAAIGFAGIDPGLIRERRRPGRGAALAQVLKLLLTAHLVVAALDAGRFHWSDSVPTGLQWTGLAGFAVGWALPVWSMIVNRFFSTVVRLQADRGHHVVTTGPYRLVRHPGYAGMILGSACSGLALDSWISMLPCAVFVAWVLRRARLEDRFLLEHLDGYAAYAETVRWRLLPGVW
jgi:protein-S-isoprenylcysteine O-methyltransferase Ste14